MRTKVAAAAPENALARILEALGQELIDASEEEILEAAKDLGMNPLMKGSAAFAGLKYFSKARPEDFFDLEAYKALQLGTERTAKGSQKPLKRKARRPKTLDAPGGRNDSDDD